MNNSMFDKKNAEGYSDPTAYQAVKNMIKSGEVWTVQRKDDAQCEVLVVAYNDNVATILYLLDEYKAGCIEVVGSDVKWVNPRMLNWTWGGYFGKCVRKLSVQEFNQVGVEMEKILAIRIVNETVHDPMDSPEIESMKAELAALHCRCNETDAVALKYEIRLKKAESDADKYRIQLDLMKDMYADLMEKFLQKVG